MAARLRIRSTSSFGPEKPNWLNGYQSALNRLVEVFLDSLSKPQVPPTILLN